MSQLDKSFLESATPLFDVRSPGEYARAHLPGAINLPLFTDEARAEVGTCYKRQGPREALLLGLERVGPKLASLVQEVARHAESGEIRLYCWRGGMRSQSVAQLLKAAGYKPNLLPGGYKRFRRWALDQLEVIPPLRVLGGFTGSGKSEYLQTLAAQGEWVLDLERLANHRGSAFGALGPQPTQEAFENSLAWELSRMQGKTVWIEDESRAIGSCRIPGSLYEAMQRAPLYRLNPPFEERCQRLIDAYGKMAAAELIAATERLKKRLGSERTRAVIEGIQQGDQSVVAVLLDYYDRAYLYGLEKRKGPIINANEESHGPRPCPL